MASLNLIDSCIVYINPEPGYEYQFACHSHVVPLGGDDLLWTFQRGQALYSRDSVLVPSRSTDGGRNWAAETLIHDPVATRMINWENDRGDCACEACVYLV